MERRGVEAWLAAYGRAWESKDTAAFAALFSEDARYHWTPFEEPKTGRAEIAAAVAAAVARQRDIRFQAEVLSWTPPVATVHWSASFDRVSTGRRVRLDGTLRAEFDEHDLCRVFQEWWHSDEAPDARPAP